MRILLHYSTFEGPPDAVYWDDGAGLASHEVRQTPEVMMGKVILRHKPPESTWDDWFFALADRLPTTHGRFDLAETRKTPVKFFRDYRAQLRG